MSDETLSRERILDVAEEVFRRYGPARATVVDGARALGVSHGARLYDWLWTVMKSKRELAAGDPELFALYMALRTESREVVCEHLRELRQQIAQILADGLTSGEFVGLDPEATAEAILVATTRFHNPVHAQEWSDPEIDRSFERVWQLIRDGLYGSPIS
jgi:AcrR family transcriptional regulator